MMIFLALGLLTLVWICGWYRYRMNNAKWIGKRNIIGFVRYWYYKRRGYIIADRYYIKKGK